jgi:6-phosphogluconolactonase
MPYFTSQTHPDPATTAAALAADFARWIINSPGTLNIAFSGGRTPELFFMVLAEEKYRTLPWHRLRCFWVDERWVPHNSRESNFGNACRQLFVPLGFPHEQLFPMVEATASPDDSMDQSVEIRAAAERYSRLLHRKLPLIDDVPAFDLVLLGMGSDGHTASLFPGVVPEMPEATCSVARHPTTGAARLTLTLPVINHARQVAFLITGTDKAATVLAVRNGSDPGLPAAAVKPTSNPIAWYLDAGANPARR